jgi:hypothetical protein
MYQFFNNITAGLGNLGKVTNNLVSFSKKTIGDIAEIENYYKKMRDYDINEEIASQYADNDKGYTPYNPSIRHNAPAPAPVSFVNNNTKSLLAIGFIGLAGLVLLAVK